MAFSDINPSSWRQGDAVVRRLLGPVKHVKQPHSPPTRDILKDGGSADAQSRMYADDQSQLAVDGSLPSSMHISDVLPDELEHSRVSVHQEAAPASPVERMSNGAAEVTDLTASMDAASSHGRSLPDATNTCELNVQEPTIHHISIKHTGNVLFRFDVSDLFLGQTA